MPTGLLLPSREVILWADSDFASLVGMAQKAEEAGFDSVWVGDSLLARPRGEPLSLLSAIAGATTSIQLGTAVLLPLLRHPLTLAHQAATLDRLSRGRLILGIGPAADLPGTHSELKAVGVGSDRRITDLMLEVEACRRLWRGEDTAIDLQPKPVHPNGPPLWLGAGGPRMLRLTGERFDGWLPLIPTPEAYAAAYRLVREAAENAGRDPDSVATGVYLTVAAADGQAEAEKQMDDYIRAYYGIPAAVFAQGAALHAGTLESAREWFGAYRHAGAQHVVVRLAAPGLRDYSEAARSLLEMAREG